MSHISERGDEAVQATNDDATICKRSAINLGYWSDPFLQYFIKGPIVRKPPEINRGYFGRTLGVYNLILQAIRELNSIKSMKKDEQNNELTCLQIINLGSGFDTLYWRLKNDEQVKSQCENCKISNFVELDFPSTTQKKIQILKNSKKLLDDINNDDGEIKFSHYDLHAFDYHIMGVDLRDINQVSEKLKSSGINFNLPTIFLAECVLVYMEANASKNLLSWISQNFKTSLFINYEQVNMMDNFANVMLKNLNMRGCSLAGVEYCRSLTTQQERFLETGWKNVKVWTMNEVYASFPPEDILKIEKLEMLDEKELLKQLFDHYCIVVSYNDQLSVGFDAIAVY